MMITLAGFLKNSLIKTIQIMIEKLTQGRVNLNSFEFMGLFWQMWAGVFLAVTCID